MDLKALDNYADISCINKESQNLFSNIMIGCCSMILVFCLCVLKCSYKKKEWIQKPIRRNDHTYCYLSLSIIKQAQAILILTIVSMTLQIIIFVPRQKVFEMTFFRVLFLLKAFISYLIHILFATTMYTQYKEWHVMNYLISS